MKHHTRVAAALGLSAILAAPVLQASPVHLSSPAHAMFGKAKSATVKFSLRNASSVPLEIKIDDKVMTLDPGKPMELNLPVGTRILANTATPNHAVGSLIEEVSKEHAGATIVVR